MPAPLNAACISACQACVAACRSGIESCIDCEEARLRPCIELCRSCMRICSLILDELGLGSGFATVQSCRLGALICRACAEECEGVDEPLFATVADAARRCAEACHAIAQHGYPRAPTSIDAAAPRG